MKTIIFFAIIMTFFGVVFPQDQNYKDDIKRIYELTKVLYEYIDNNTLDFNVYDKWYSEFSNLRDNFVNKYITTYSKEEFFKIAREAFDKFSLAWGFLKDVEYAKAQYNEYISINDIHYAHKWKETANTKKKDAVVSLAEAKSLLEKIK